MIVVMISLYKAHDLQEFILIINTCILEHFHYGSQKQFMSTGSLAHSQCALFFLSVPTILSLSLSLTVTLSPSHLSIYLYLFIYIFLYLSISVTLFVCLSAHLSICLSFHPSIYASIYFFVTSISLSVSLSSLSLFLLLQISDKWCFSIDTQNASFANT